MKKITIYTDGACSGNPGPGGWAAIVFDENKEVEYSGGESLTTNQRMEMRAAVEGLRALKEPSEVGVYSDSAYLVNAFNQKWLERWGKNGWRTVSKKPVENRDLWEELVRLARIHRVTWHKVQGHSTDVYNQRCDTLARSAIPRKD